MSNINQLPVLNSTTNFTYLLATDNRIAVRVPISSIIAASTSTGPTGPQGIVGPIGPQGTAGLGGSQGPTGPQGIIGPTGPAGGGGGGGGGTQGPQGPTGPTGAPGTSIFNGGTVVNDTTFSGKVIVNNTLTAATLLVGSSGVGTVQSNNDLQLKAAGNVLSMSPFILKNYITSQLPAISAPPVGTMVFVTDAVGGAQPCYYDGTHWYTVNGRTQVA